MLKRNLILFPILNLYCKLKLDIFENVYLKQRIFVKIVDSDDNEISIGYKKETELIESVITRESGLLLEYNDEKLLQTLVGQDGNKLSFSYDTDGELISVRYPSLEGKCETIFTYRNDGLESITDRTGLVTTIATNRMALKSKLTQHTKVEKIDNEGLSELSQNKVIMETSFIHTGKMTFVLNELNMDENSTLLFDRKGRLVGSRSGSMNYHRNECIETLSYFHYENDEIVLEASADTNLTLPISVVSPEEGLSNVTHLTFTECNLEKLENENEGVIVIVTDPTLNVGKGEITIDLIKGTKTIRTYKYQYMNDGFIMFPVKLRGTNLNSIRATITSNHRIESNQIAFYQGTYVMNEFNKDKVLVEQTFVNRSVKSFQLVDNQPTKVVEIDKFGDKTTTIYQYDLNRNIKYQEDTNGDVVEYFYDEKSRLIEKRSYNKQSASDKIIEKRSYDERGRVVSENAHGKPDDSEAVTTSLGYDHLTGELIEIDYVCDELSNKLKYRYKLGELVGLSHHGINVDYQLDGLGRKTKVSVAGQEMLSSEYVDLLETTVSTPRELDRTVKVKSEKSTTGDGKVSVEVIKTLDDRTLRIIESNSDSGETRTIDYNYDSNDNLVNKKFNDITILGQEFDSSGKLVTRIHNPNADSASSFSESFVYDNKDRIIEHTVTSKGVEDTINVTYKNDKVDKIANGDLIYSTLSDAVTRPIEEKVSRILNDESIDTIIKDSYQYLKKGAESTALIKKHTSKVKNNLDLTTTYKYDAEGNIISACNDNSKVTYEYDFLGRIIRENNKSLNETILFEYDTGGNITTIKNCEFCVDDDDLVVKTTKLFVYKEDGWKDQLVKTLVYNSSGELIEQNNYSFDCLGNPVSYNDLTIEYTAFKQISGFGNELSCTYDLNGKRSSKTSGGSTTNFLHMGDRLLKQVEGTNVLEFKYLGAKLVGFSYNNIENFYQRNIQGDVIAIYDTNGSLKAKYTYDAWGNHETLNYDLDLIGDINPIRYRGYCFDVETKLYYLNARYYDASIGRFISADHVSYLDPDTIHGLNLYAYCGNNPVMRVDPTGNAFFTLLIASLIIVATAVLVGSLIGGSVSASNGGDFGQGALTGLIVGVMIGVTILSGGATAGLTAAMGGGFWAAVGAGAIVGEASGGIIGAGSNLLQQGLTVGYEMLIGELLGLQLGKEL